MAEPHAFRRAAESKDLELMRETLREDVVLHSPILFRGFEGRDLVLVVLGHVIEVLEGFRYVAEAREGNTVFLQFKAMVGELELDGIDVLQLDGEDRVADITVFMRPLSALTRFNERMGERLAASQAGPG